MKKEKKALRVIGNIIGVIILAIIILATYNKIALKVNDNKIIPNGQMINVEEYKVHVYSEGKNDERPSLVFLAGSGTIAPVYDFKSLYSLLSNKYRITVVEKVGYGYSDIIEIKRDVETMVTEARNALMGAKIKAPYVLVPHSMSGLEALHWAQNYPNEIAGIVGLDMAVPCSYDNFDFSKMKQMLFLGKITVEIGLLRIPGVYPLSSKGLSEKETYQQQLLMYRNAVNSVHILESKAVYDNAQTVKNGADISCPIIMFSSNGKEIGDFWILTQEKFAEENNAKITIFDNGHYLHYYKSKEMAIAIEEFIEELYLKEENMTKTYCD